MKKIALYGLMALMSGAFVACDNYEEPNPPAQTNAQESILKTDDVTVASAIADAEYNLAELNTNATPIEIATVTTTQLPEAYELVSHVEMARDENSAYHEVESSIEQDADDASLFHVYVAPDDLQGVFQEYVSKAPSAKTVVFRLSLATNIVNNKKAMEALIGGPGNYYGPWQMTVLPIPSEVVIEDAYYLLGTINGWDVATAIKFNHSGANPYDDPVFSLKVDITEAQAADGWWWKVIPASTYEAGAWQDEDYSQWGPAENGDEALEGMIVPKKNGVDAGAGCVKVFGEYLITINMLEGTYAFTEAVSQFYTPGDSNGWNHGNSQVLTTSDYVNYSGFANLSTGGFKFTSAPNWDAKYNLGAGIGEGLLVNGSNDNLTVPENGLYWVSMNLPALTYQLTHISTIGLIGDATPNGWDASTALTPSADNLVWTGTIHLKGGEFKFRANNAWDVNLGGALENLTPGGSNIASPGEGTYEVTLNLSQVPYSATFVKK